MNTQLTQQEKSLNDFLHTDHPDLMKKAYRAFSRYAKFYGGLYGYDYKGYSNYSKDIYILARLFENDYAELMGVTSQDIVLNVFDYQF